MDGKSHPNVYQLVARKTLNLIGAGLRVGSGSERCEWRINRPAYVTEAGGCYLVLTRDFPGTYTVAIYRDGTGPKVDIEAERTNIADLDVDGVVQELFYQRPEVSNAV